MNGFVGSLIQPGFWLQPILYAAHGWLATEMALMMLFRPYEPKYLPGTKLQLPFTPGIFPRGRHKLSIAIANTVTEILLTQEDLKKQAQKLVTEENLYQALDALLKAVGQEFRDIGRIRQVYHHMETLVPKVVHQWAKTGFENLENGDDKLLEGFFRQLFGHLLPHLHLNHYHGEMMSDLVFTTVLTPNAVREGMVDLLTESNVAQLEKTLLNQLHGLQGLLLRFLDLQKGARQFREFLIQHPHQANELILQAIDQLELREKLAQKLVRFSPQHLSAETLEMVEQYLLSMTRTALIANQEELSQSLASLSREATQSLTHQLLHLPWSEEWLTQLKQDMAKFLYTYLNEELENMLSKALPLISMNTVIVEKIDRFSAKQLEETIQKICHRELRWLAMLGAFLGFWLGLISNFLRP